MGSRTEGALLAVLTVAAAAMASAMVKREFFATRPPRTDALDRAPTFVAEWRDVARDGIELGDPGAPIKLVEFTDLECPFCRRFHRDVLPAVLKRFAGKVSVVLLHYPLPMHRFAAPAARGAECAARQAAFAEFVDAVFAKQDSLGLRTWSAYAIEAGLKDTVAFNSCLVSEGPWLRIDAGLAAAARLGVRGTPGVMVNGWLFAIPPSEVELAERIDKLLTPGVP